MTDETIARLRITLNDTDPSIWRVVDVPLTASLKMLHDIMQAAMGWQDYTSGSSRPEIAATACKIPSGPMTSSPPRTSSSRH